jgi:hypothetical protein
MNNGDDVKEERSREGGRTPTATPWRMIDREKDTRDAA